jgi:uncharacterized protein YdeI (YjbR/CyaY-like superfamily)
MRAPDGFEIVSAPASADWRSWLARNGAEQRGAWLVIQKKGSPEPGVTYEEAVEEALAFGWIDSRANRMSDTAFRIMFTPRRPGGTWAASNKARVERLIADGRMTPAGLALVQAAKADGSWNALDEADARSASARAAHRRPPERKGGQGT